MKQRYCISCGNLLSEDGVCLHCGSRYELTDDGQLKVIQRKVKSVSVKSSVKKTIKAKKASGFSETTIQDYPILEDIYSFSDNAKIEETPGDWNDESKLVEEKPVVVDYAHNDALAEKTHFQRTQRTQMESRKPSYKTKQKNISPSIAFFVFVVAAIAAGLLTYSFLANRSLGSRNSDEQAIETPTQNVTTNINKKEVGEKPISKLLQCKITYPSGGLATYAYDEEQGTLSISLSGSDDYSYAFLPLVSLGDFASNLVYMASLTQPPFQDAQLPFEENYPILFCYSDLINNGTIKSVLIKTDNEIREYIFTVNDNLLASVKLNGRTSYGETEESFVESLTYGYDTFKRLITIDSDSKYNNYSFSMPLFRFQYDQNGNLSSYDWYYSEIGEPFPEKVLIDSDAQQRVSKTYYETRNDALYEYQYDNASRLIRLLGEPGSGYSFTTVLTYTEDGLLSAIQTVESGFDNAAIRFSY